MTMTKEEFTKLLDERIAAAVQAGLVDATSAFATKMEGMDKFGARLDALEKSRRTHHLPGSEDDTHDGDTYSFNKVFAGLTTGDIEKHAPMEYAMSEELFAQGTVPDTAGGFLVPTQVFEDQIIPILKPQVIALALGITTLPVTGAGVVEIPRQVSRPTNETVAENEPSGETEIEFGNHRLEPRTAQSYLRASRRFLGLGAGADAFLRRALADELALTWNRWILKGTGADGEPTGVLNTPGIATVDFNNTVTSGRVTPDFYKKLLAMEDALADNDALMGAGRLGFAAANKFVRACRQIESDNNAAGTSNLEMQRNVVTAGANPTILDYPYQRTTQLAQGAVTDAIFGDWAMAVLATWNNLSMEASNVAGDALKRRQTHIVAYIDVDVAVTQPKSFAIAENLDTSSI